VIWCLKSGLRFDFADLVLVRCGRKDSEQTKHIEELEERNKELRKINLSLQGCDMQM
jgi:hypothetical protein